MLKAVLFDLDGTLVDTERLYLQANAQASAALGHPLPAAAFTRLVGASNLAQHPWLVAQFGHQLPQFIARSEAIVAAKLAQEQVAPRPGATALLTALHRRGVKLGVVTVSSRAYVQRVLALMTWPPFAVVVTGEAGPNKPAPALYQHALASLHLPTAAVVAVEDTPSGVLAATRAGLRCVQVVDLAPRSAAATVVVPDLAAAGAWLATA